MKGIFDKILEKKKCKCFIQTVGKSNKRQALIYTLCPFIVANILQNWEKLGAEEYWTLHCRPNTVGKCKTALSIQFYEFMLDLFLTACNDAIGLSDAMMDQKLVI